MFEVTTEELQAGIEALQAPCICTSGRNFEDGPWFDPDPDCVTHGSEQRKVEVVLAAMLPVIGERLQATAEQDAVHMIAAIVIASGGRVAVPMKTYREAQISMLQRYDDLATSSIVFETPISDVA